MTTQEITIIVIIWIGPPSNILCYKEDAAWRVLVKGSIPGPQWEGAAPCSGHCIGIYGHGVDMSLCGLGGPNIPG